MKQKLFFLFSILSFTLYAQNITLELNPSLKNQMNITEDPAGTYDIQTLGGDPWIVTRPVETYDPNQVYVISFDYIATNGLDNFQIFYGAPINPTNRRKDFGSLAPATEYTTFKAFMKYEVGNWSVFDRFRFDFGRAAGQNIMVKNVQLRAALPGEVVPLALNLARRNQISVVENPEDTYSISSLGTDPFIYSETITTPYDPNKTFVLAFDYTSSTGLDDLQVFYGKPTSPARRVLLGAVTEASSKTNISVLMTISAPVWDSFYDEFRFDFGRFAGQDITVSNLVLREPTNAEKKLLEPKETVQIELNVNTTSGGLDATEVGTGSYVLNTSGNDPWIRSKSIEVLYDIEQSYIISFEYRTETAYNDLEIFYGPPIIGTQKLSAGEIPAATEWTTYTINPRLLVDNFQDNEWTDFRFDFGKNENEAKTIEVRNIKIRKPTAQELEDEQNSDKFLSVVIDQEFRDYLNTTYANTISLVKIDTDLVNISGSVTNATEELFLAEIEPHQYGFNQSEFNFITPITIINDTFNVDVERFVQKPDHDYDRLYSRWVIVRKTGESTYEYTSNAKWAGDISAIALNNIEEDKASSIKGLDGLGPSTLSNFSDLTDLDIKSMKLNLLLNGVLSLNPTGMTHEFNGKIYNISPGFVTGFDQRIKRLTDNGIKAAFVLLIPLNIGNEDLRRIFVHPDASLGLYSMANVATEEGAEYYAAVVDFLAERYSRPDKLYGRLDQWIIHNEVDAHTNWTHAGAKPVSLYTQIYDRSMRMVHYTIRKHNPSAKVFGSFTKHWNSVAGSSANFKSKDILDVLVKLSDKEEDFEWGIGWHSYPTNLFNPKVWNDPAVKTQLNFDTPEITPKNLEMIDAYVRQKDVLYNGKKVRTILLSENGFSSNTAKNPNASETNQAAALAYFWKKTNLRLPAIENIQLHRWVDNPNEAGLEFGLWTVLDGTNDGFDRKKEGWYVWEAAGTANENAVFDPYKSVIGINDWNEIYNDVTTEVTPYVVKMNIENCGSNLDDLLVGFNGELKIPQQDGSLIFYNVASNVSQPYTIKKGSVVLASDVLNITEDTELNINLIAIENISAKGNSPSEIEINWDSNLQDIQGFVIEVKEEGGSFSELERVSAETFSYVHTGVITGDRYTYRIAAILDEDTLSCYSAETSVIAPFIIVQYKDGDKNKTANNAIKPQLKLINEADYGVALNRLSVRYWFTVEDFAPLNFYVDYARLGTSDVKGSFVALDDARDGANYYLEINFETNNVIEALGNSGEIKTRIAKSDWTDFDETNDHSYSNFNQYVETDKITVYWDGELIWGEEPEISDEQNPEIIVLYKNKDGVSNNSIKPNLSIINTGNQPVGLEDITLRYWFTPEGASPLNYNIDYAVLNKSNIVGTFDESTTPYSGATNYFEVGFEETAGQLYAYSETGEIKFRIHKQNWSSFDESDDFSYKNTVNDYSENSKITAYINGQLVWGEEPNEISNSNGDDISNPIVVYPNPATHATTLIWSESIITLDDLYLVDYMNIAHPVQSSIQDKELSIQLSNLNTGIFVIKGVINGQAFTHRLLVE
mgnify:FL=1|tara:strand:- start:9731 stop:14392 length:4662 start_codon:yes stop_codon:yes gene_type:complete